MDLGAALSGALNVFTPGVIGWVIGATIIGIIVGIIPGISGVTVTAMALPLIFNMNPAAALAALVALNAVSVTGGSLTAILVNVPGDIANAATLLDGYPMSQRGQAGRAVGASLASSGLGGLFGGLIFLAFIPIAYQVILAMGSPETFLLDVAGLCFISVLSSGNIRKGLTSGLLGILFSFVGMKGMTAIPRFSFGTLYLMDGVPLVPIFIGLMALPSLYSLAVEGDSGGAKLDDAAKKAATNWRQQLEGVKDVFRHWKVFLMSSGIGVIIGMIPGIGGSTSTFLAYAQAKQFSKHPEKFGTGIVEGVIAPEAAANAKEGGNLVPTLAFGIPAGSSMVLILAALIILGIAPGPGMLKDHLDITFTMLTTLIFANLVAIVFLLPFISQLSKLCYVPNGIMVPVIMVLCGIAAYTMNGSYMDVILTFVFSIMGVLMARYGYERVPFILGFILGIMAERSLFVSLATVGPAFMLKPIDLVLEVIIVAILTSGWIRKFVAQRRAAAKGIKA